MVNTTLQTEELAVKVILKALDVIYTLCGILELIRLSTTLSLSFLTPLVRIVSVSNVLAVTVILTLRSYRKKHGTAWDEESFPIFSRAIHLCLSTITLLTIDNCISSLIIAKG